MTLSFRNDFMKLYPMKAKGLEPEKIPWDSPEYIWEEKFDGDRRLLWLTADGNYNTSRNKSKKTDLPTDKTDNTPHLRDIDFSNIQGTILDGEFIHKKGFEYVRKIMGALPEKALKTQAEHGYIEYVVYDILCYKGKFLDDMPLKERKLLLKGLFDTQIESDYIHQSQGYRGGDRKLLEGLLSSIIDSGGEGMVAKHEDSLYRISREKCLVTLKNGWIKVKKDYVGDFVVMGFEEPNKIYTGDHLDTHEYWEDDEPVTEYYAKGWIGGIVFGEYKDGALTIVGSVSSGLTKEKRAEISFNQDAFIGEVIEVSAMERDKKTTALRHPVIERFRDDKEPEDCIYENQKG